MKKIFTLAILLLSFLFSQAQSYKQVKWNYTVKKIADKTYEVHMTANISGNYHLYAQNPGVEGPVPTTFNFTKNPLIVLDGKIKENGNLQKKYESAWDGQVNYFKNAVNFIQVVKLKANVKTNLAGKVEFMVCDDKQCLPPSDVEFKVNIGG
jgi:thiol:disulfide interchange protein DsbD